MYPALKLSLIASCAVSAISFSQSSLAQQTNNITDEIVVTAKGNQTLADVLPTSDIFGLDDIQASQANDLPELLDQLTGVSVNDSGGRGSVTGTFVRGLSSTQTIVLIDGVRVGSASLGAAALNSYPIEAIERIEVVKGPLSGIYGADAASGVIHLFTKKGNTSSSSVSATIGSDALTEFDLGLRGGNDNASFHIGAHIEETDGIDRTSIVTDGNDDRDAFEESAFSFGGRLALNANTTANLSLLYTDNTSEFDNTFGADTGFFTDTETFSSALNINSQLSNKLTWRATLGLNTDESVTPAFFSDITTNRESIGSELIFAVDKNTSITAGLDYYQEDIETLDDFPVTDRDNSGAFVLLQSKFAALEFVGNLRYDDNSAYGTDTNSSLALNYDLNNNTRIVASYGTAFSAPSFNFLFFPFFGNPDLLPEETESVEVSLLGSNQALNWRVSAYQTEVTNLFSFDPVTFLAANIGEADIEGVEFELGTSFADWQFALNIDLLSAENAATGIELDDRAEQTISTQLSRSFGKLNLSFAGKYESDRFDLSGTELDSYLLFDINANYQITDNFSIHANIDNIFDEDFTVNLISLTERFNTQGRQSKVTIRYTF